MVDAQRIASRILAANEALQHLASERPGISPGALAENAMLRAAVERWLQIAIEACTDIAYHVCAEQGWQLPPSAREAFLILATHGRIELGLAERMGQAAALRNILVHEYIAVDLKILCQVVEKDVLDLECFLESVACWLE